MAVGDITLDSQIRSGGDHTIVTGTLEANSTATAFQIVPTTNHILYASLVNTDNVDTYLQVTLNSNNGTVDTDKGSIWVDTSSSNVDTLAFTVGYI